MSALDADRCRAANAGPECRSNDLERRHIAPIPLRCSCHDVYSRPRAKSSRPRSTRRGQPGSRGRSVRAVGVMPRSRRAGAGSRRGRGDGRGVRSSRVCACRPRFSGGDERPHRRDRPLDSWCPTPLGAGRAGARCGRYFLFGSADSRAGRKRATTTAVSGGERRGDEQADAHRLGEGVAGRREHAGGRLGRELSRRSRWRRRPSPRRPPAPAAGRPPSEPSTSFE